MPWNWELAEWPHFYYETEGIADLEKRFLIEIGGSLAFLKSTSEEEKQQFVVEILTAEGVESAKIEGELLDRRSLQSSIQRHFGIQPELQKEAKKEAAMAQLLCNVYENFDKPLSHEMLFHWHSLLFKEERKIVDRGSYRTHPEPMQIVSSRYPMQGVYFEAPPSEKVPEEMQKFIQWVNSSKPKGSLLCRAAIAHIYFESIHPFEDGNGRIGRALVEKILSQELGRPVLIPISKILERNKKDYYSALERCNKTLDMQPWIEFFAKALLQAQNEAMKYLVFFQAKAKLFQRLDGLINERQEKALLRMFKEGVEGFKGGLSANNYLSINKTSRATATRDLADLVEKGALIKIGELRHARYVLNIDADIGK